MLVLKRIALAITGYACAVLAHIITVFILLFVLSMIVTNPASWSIMPFVAVSFYVMPFLLVAAFLFALMATWAASLCLAAAGELLSIRSRLYYWAAAMIVGAVFYVRYSPRTVFGLSFEAFVELSIFAAAGLVSGTVYWFIVGRSAGLKQRAG